MFPVLLWLHNAIPAFARYFGPSLNVSKSSPENKCPFDDAHRSGLCSREQEKFSEVEMSKHVGAELKIEPVLCDSLDGEIHPDTNEGAEQLEHTHALLNRTCSCVSFLTHKSELDACQMVLTEREMYFGKSPTDSLIKRRLKRFSFSMCASRPVRSFRSLIVASPLLTSQQPIQTLAFLVRSTRQTIGARFHYNMNVREDVHRYLHPGSFLSDSSIRPCSQDDLLVMSGTCSAMNFDFGGARSLRWESWRDNSIFSPGSTHSRFLPAVNSY